MSGWRRNLPDVSLALLSIVSSLAIWAAVPGGTETLYRHWDSPNDLTVARTLYRIRPDNPLLQLHNETRTRSPSLASRLPLYPLLVRAFSWIGYRPALLLVSLLAAAVAVVLFYRLARDVWKLSSPYYLSLVFLFLPPRWFLYRSVGATESLYMALTLASIFFFERARYGRSALAASLATLTRITGLMFLPAYGIVLLQRGARRAVVWLCLPALAFLSYCVFCAFRFGDFFAYFRPHEEKFSTLLPFGIVPWLVGVRLVHQAEFHILLAIAYAVGIAQLRRFPVLFWYSVFQWLLLVFIATEDWSRYFLSMAPFALVIGYRQLLEERLVRWIFPLFVVLSFFYAQAVIPTNLLPIGMYNELMAHLGLK